MAEEPEKFKSLVQETLRRHVAAINKLADAGKNLFCCIFGAPGVVAVVIIIAVGVAVSVITVVVVAVVVDAIVAADGVVIYVVVCCSHRWWKCILLF